MAKLKWLVNFKKQQQRNFSHGIRMEPDFGAREFIGKTDINA